jgi:hypothetical protein
MPEICSLLLIVDAHMQDRTLLATHRAYVSPDCKGTRQCEEVGAGDVEASTGRGKGDGTQDLVRVCLQEAFLPAESCGLLHSPDAAVAPSQPAARVATKRVGKFGFDHTVPMLHQKLLNARTFSLHVYLPPTASRLSRLQYNVKAAMGRQGEFLRNVLRACYSEEPFLQVGL